MFTPLFAIGRMPGWIAHWREMNSEANTRISRPQQVYIGEAERSI
jgi:citrate synthase